MISLALIKTVKKLMNGLPCMSKYVAENAHCQPQYYRWKKNLNGKELCIHIADVSLYPHKDFPIIIAISN